MTDAAVWIKTEPSTDGSAYVVTAEFSDDRAKTLTPEVALRYGSAVLAAAQRAEYDAAVARQLTRIGSDLDAALQIVTDLRNDRPPLDDEATAPLALDPGVNKRLAPFLVVKIDGEAVGQWTVGAAREHASHVLEAVAAADLDSNYYRALTGIVGLDEGRARAVVGDLGQYRDEAASG